MRTWLETILADRGGAFRLALIAVLTLLLLIPLAMVDGVISERSWRHKEVLRDIARQQGGVQRLVGPFVAVPIETAYEKQTTDPVTGDVIPRTVRQSSFAIVLAADLKVEAKLAHEMRRRSIYAAPVYRADVAISGTLARPDLAKTIPNLANADWAKAAVVLGVSDLTGLAAAKACDFAGKDAAFEAGAPAFAAGLFQSGQGPKHGYSGEPGGLGAIHAPVDLSKVSDGPARFQTGVTLNGSGGLFLAPLAGDSRLAIAGDWPHPSFQGAPLPAERQVSAEGFEAAWTIPALARGYGQVWYGQSTERLLQAAAAGAVGFNLARPDDSYNAALRAVKYGVLFVTLTFLACFVMERFGGQRLHAAQYGLVGLSLALFYLLLIALAERIGLVPAYVVAALTIAGLNGAYIGVAMASLKRGLAVGGALGLLYAAFYVMLASEDDALLIGAGMLLLGLALAMAATARLKSGRDAVASPPAPS